MITLNPAVAADACTLFWSCVENDLNAQFANAAHACSSQAAAKSPGGIAACLARIPISQSAAEQACSTKHLSCPPIAIVLDYIVATLVYAPPGNASNVLYGQGSTAGSTQGFSLSSGYTATASASYVDSGGGGVKGGAYGFSFGFSITTGDSLGGGTISATQYQMQFQKGSENTISLYSKTDPIQHGKDEFWIWFHPTMVVTQTGPQTYNFQIVPPGAADVVPLSVNELLGQEPVPSDKAAQFNMLTQNDIKSILALDPFTAAKPVLDPNRYVLLASDQQPLQVFGPDNPGDNIPAVGIKVTDATTQSKTETETFNSVSGVSNASGANAAIDLGVLSLRENNTGTGGGTSSTQQQWTWSNSTSFQTSTGVTQEATMTLYSSTVGYNDIVDIYEDTLYHTFLFVSETNGNLIPPSEPPVLMGTVFQNGQPLANQLVEIHLADGTSRRVVTNAKGLYRAYRVPTGPAGVAIGTLKANKVLSPQGTTTIQNIELR